MEHIMFKGIVVGLSMVLSLVGVSSAIAQSNCQSTLAYLAPKLRNYRDPKLQQMRTAILNNNISEVMANMRKQGLSPAAASEILLKQAATNDEAMQQAEECAVQSHYDSDGQRIREQLRDDTLSLDLSCDSGAFSACACSYVIQSWLKLSNRETALQIACHGK
jgi:hypothetical protein